MPRDDIFPKVDISRMLKVSSSNTKKRNKLNATERIYIWEHPGMYGRNCSICNEKIKNISDLELDHTRAYSKGGKKLRLAHKLCNRMKGSKSLKHVQKRMGFKTSSTKRKTKNKRTRKSNNPFDDLKLNLPNFGV